jgi:hypothetical protein
MVLKKFFPSSPGAARSRGFVFRAFPGHGRVMREHAKNTIYSSFIALTH